MATKRLNSSLRERIRDRLMSRAMQGERAHLESRYSAWAQSIYQRQYTQGERKMMVELPDGWLPRASGIDVNVDGKMVWVPFNGQVRYRDVEGISRRGKEVEYRILTKDYTRNMGNHALKAKALNYARDEDKPLIDRYREIEQEYQRVHSQLRKYQKSVETVLWSVTTFKRLAEEWPEAYPVFKDLDTPPEERSRSVPVKMDDVNQALDLPPEEKSQ